MKRLIKWLINYYKWLSEFDHKSIVLGFVISGALLSSGCATPSNFGSTAGVILRSTGQSLSQPSKQTQCWTTGNYGSYMTTCNQ